MSRALIRPTTAITVVALLLAGSVVPAAASSAQDQTISIPAPDQVSEVIALPEWATAMVAALDPSVAEVAAVNGVPMNLGGIGLLVFGPVLAAVMYEGEQQYSVARG